MRGTFFVPEYEKVRHILLDAYEKSDVVEWAVEPAYGGGDDDASADITVDGSRSGLLELHRLLERSDIDEIDIEGLLVDDLGPWTGDAYDAYARRRAFPVETCVYQYPRFNRLTTWLGRVLQPITGPVARTWRWLMGRKALPTG